MEQHYNLLKYYERLHNYYNDKKDDIYKILKNITNNNILMDNQVKNEKINNKNNNENTNNTTNGDFNDFYFYYIQKIKAITKRGSFNIKNNKVYIKNANDFLVGINFSKYKIGTQFKIFLNYFNIRKQILSIVLNEKNKNITFLPINNKNFIPYFLSDNNLKVEIISSEYLNKEIDLIFLQLHRKYNNLFLNYGTFLINYDMRTFIEFTNYKIDIKYYNNNDIQNFLNNEYVFYYDIHKYYGRKILKYFQNRKIKNFLKDYLYYNFNIYTDINNIISNMLFNF